MYFPLDNYSAVTTAQYLLRGTAVVSLGKYPATTWPQPTPPWLLHGVTATHITVHLKVYVQMRFCGKAPILLASGLIRHRALQVDKRRMGQRALECSLGSRGRPLGGLLEQF